MICVKHVLFLCSICKANCMCFIIMPPPKIKSKHGHFCLKVGSPIQVASLSNLALLPSCCQLACFVRHLWILHFQCIKKTYNHFPNYVWTLQMKMVFGKREFSIWKFSWFSQICLWQVNVQCFCGIGICFQLFCVCILFAGVLVVKSLRMVTSWCSSQTATVLASCTRHWLCQPL